MLVRMLTKLWSWEVIGIAAPFLYGLGVAAMYGDQYALANSLYFIAITLLVVKVLTWEETHILEKRKRYLLASLIVLLGASVFFVSLQ